MSWRETKADYSTATMPSKKQKKLNRDYANFLVEYEAAKSQGIALGTFLEWLHKNDPDGIKIDETKKR